MVVSEDCEPLDAADDGIRWMDVAQEGSSNYRGPIASVSDARCIDGITIAERNANARLIAAAPELLESCKQAKCYLNNCESITVKHAGVEWPNLDAAIAKAEGRTP